MTADAGRGRVLLVLLRTKRGFFFFFFLRTRAAEGRLLQGARLEERACSARMQVCVCGGVFIAPFNFILSASGSEF